MIVPFVNSALQQNYMYSTILLGIRQTLQSQGKSFFKFLFSGEKDIDKFK